MITFVYALSLGIAFFAFGYYLGNQVGRTEHIRQQLERVRVNRAHHQP